KELQIHSKHLAGEKEITVLLESFAAMADKPDVLLVSIPPYELKSLHGSGKDDYFYEMPIKIAANCGYHQLGDFVSKINMQNRIIVIDNIDIAQNAKLPRAHNVMMMVKTYVSVGD
ncbi:MAG: type 4a pilus biogenesis protein PilO, partial [Candidatus Omnitrophica bacterium]|nr:type 4a pilus biogenesis protein PilO [Candidatus Omnitrophota bacterium]